MKLDEMMDEMAARTEFDDAYADTLAAAFGNAEPAEMDRAFERMRDALARQTPAQKECTQKLNLALVKRPEFVEALKRHHERHAGTKVPKEPEGSTFEATQEGVKPIWLSVAAEEEVAKVFGYARLPHEMGPANCERWIEVLRNLGPEQRSPTITYWQEWLERCGGFTRKSMGPEGVETP